MFESVYFFRSIFDKCIINGTIFANIYARYNDWTNCNITHTRINFSEQSEDNTFRNNNIQSNNCALPAIGTTFDIPTVCPEEGAFIAYKALTNYKIAQLLIPKDALRSSAFGRKCRASRAYVVNIFNTKSNTYEQYGVSRFAGLEYTQGQFVYPDYFDMNRWDECSHGIHFFMTKNEAIQYGETFIW